MYFSAEVKGEHHLWRQAYPNGQPEQITFGPTEEDGVAVEPSGRSLITSLGVHESAIWFHDARGDRALSSEGEVVNWTSPPYFSADDKFLYFLKLHQRVGSEPELWRVRMESGKSEAVFPGISMHDYDISPDGKEVLYSSASSDGRELWWAPLDSSSPAQANRCFRCYFPTLWCGRQDFLSTHGGQFQLPGADQPGRLGAVKGSSVPDHRVRWFLTWTTMADGGSDVSEFRHGRASDHSTRGRFAADHVCYSVLPEVVIKR
jgi:hypothetical protein